ncbi:MAG: hypothetical protein HY558_03750 [Euryarchaeota archaeon]|nr:hypothetical protein [Euryarchaeota archaeon]
MKTTSITVMKKSGRAQLGNVFFTDSKSEAAFSQIVPYIKGREDVEVLLKNAPLLKKKQPVEVNGYNIPGIITRATSLEELLLSRGRLPYSKIAINHPLIVSYPPEVLWISDSKPTALKRLRSGLKKALPATESSPSPSDADKISEEFVLLAHDGNENYRFWTNMMERKFEETPYSKLFMESIIELSNGARATFLAPPTPIIGGEKWTRSPTLAHRYNLAYAHLINDKQDTGDRVPKCLYNLDFNSEMFKPDDWSPMLEEVVRNTRLAMGENLFDGMNVSVRGLSRISFSVARVRTLNRLMRLLNDICLQNLVPINFSRFGLIGLHAIDEGSTFSSFPLNLALDDIMLEPTRMNPEYLYGRILNKDAGELYNKQQVEKVLQGPKKGLPELEGVGRAPSILQLENPVRYRIDFSKTYNIAAFNWLNTHWREEVEKGEIAPGKEYLQKFEAPYNSWGVPPTR